MTRETTKRIPIVWTAGDYTVTMRVKPQNIQMRDSKLISQQRTKAGFIIQYWGENLGEVAISGTTGRESIDGINQFREDIYRSEAKMWGEYYPIVTANTPDTRLLDVAKNVKLKIGKSKMTGYISNFSFTESADEIGLFRYEITFVVLKRSELWGNWLPWTEGISHYRPGIRE